MIVFVAAALIGAQPEIFVCSRTMRFEDQYCAARTEGRHWGHAEAAEAHELYARYALPGRAAAAYVAAANNWIAARRPEKAVTAFDRALAAGLEGAERRQALAARARAANSVGSNRYQICCGQFRFGL